jgi:hypothetical protein
MIALWYARSYFVGIWCILYLVLLFVGFLLCFRKGHLILFIAGFFLPLLWFVGAVLPDRRARRERRHVEREVRDVERGP